jgi:hypothetical protein
VWKGWGLQLRLRKDRRDRRRCGHLFRGGA